MNLRPYHRLLAATGLLLAAAGLRAQNVLYVADGDSSSSQMLMGINITNGTIQFAVNTTSATVYAGDRPSALAVTSSIWMMEHYNNPANANQYSLLGVSLNNSVALPSSLPSQFLDGTTDGTSNYSLTWNGSSNVTVYKANADWTGMTSLFSTSTLGLTSDIAGITYDFASGNLWISGNSTIYQVTMAGAVVSSFTHSGGRGSLAYQRSTDTLWYVPNNGSSALLQYNKTGTLLQSLSTPTRSGNAWGAEFSAIPEPSTTALLVLGGGLAFWVARRRRHA
jgi:hypothetical protein